MWYILESGVGAPVENMAVDEAMLERAQSRGRPVLRFYGWAGPAATFGYSQRYADAAAATALRPLVRRPTGGGLVPHDADWTYSVAIPPSDPWYALAASASYARVHEWIRRAFAELDVATELAPSGRKELPGQCFAGYEKSDLLWQGRKVAGAAQRRNRLGLLLQGSVQPPPIGLKRESWQAAMRAVARRDWGVTWEPLQGSASFTALVARLVVAKYSRADYNERR